MQVLFHQYRSQNDHAWCVVKEPPSHPQHLAWKEQLQSVFLQVLVEVLQWHQPAMKSWIRYLWVTWHGPLAVCCVLVLLNEQSNVSPLALKNVYSWKEGKERKERKVN